MRHTRNCHAGVFWYDNLVGFVIPVCTKITRENDLELTMQNLYELPTRVYIEDTDAGGIVFYVNYLKYMERARTEFMRELGYDKAAIVGDYLLVVHSTNIQYRRPALLDDELIVTAALSELGKARVVFHQRVLRGDELLCEASVTIACVKGDSMRPTPFPVGMAIKLKQLLNQ